MATSASRLKRIIREHEFKSYPQLREYVFTYCGERLRAAVIEDERDLTRYIDARSVARETVYVYSKPSHRIEPRQNCKR